MLHQFTRGESSSTEEYVPYQRNQSLASLEEFRLFVDRETHRIHHGCCSPDEAIDILTDLQRCYNILSRDPHRGKEKEFVLSQVAHICDAIIDHSENDEWNDVIAIARMTRSKNSGEPETYIQYQRYLALNSAEDVRVLITDAIKRIQRACLMDFEALDILCDLQHYYNDISVDSDRDEERKFFLHEVIMFYTQMLRFSQKQCWVHIRDIIGVAISKNDGMLKSPADKKQVTNAYPLVIIR